MKEFDIAKYMKGEGIYLENLKIENCKIAGIQSEWAKRKLVIFKCTFINVVFDNACGRGFVEIKESTFTGCSFHDTLGNGGLSIEDSLFQNSIFENVYLSENAGLETCIERSKFLGCCWKNVVLQWNIEFWDVEIYGGRVENSRFIGQAMSGCQISHIQMVNIDLKLMLMQNRLENVKFENVILNGYMSGKNTKKENIFKECDMSGFSYTEELSGFLALDSYLD